VGWVVFTARDFARDGADVVLDDVEGTDAASKEACDEGRRCIGVESDVTDRTSTDTLAALTEAEFGR
jgi:NAD(P)-dependent dehydrogenase (short-subunit alcohol dehydrogenase family)